jgi:hypothetical protein
MKKPIALSNSTTYFHESFSQKILTNNVISHATYNMPQNIKSDSLNY